MCISLQLGFLKVHLLFHVRCLFMYRVVHQTAFFLLHAFHFFAGDNNHNIFLLIRRLSQRHRNEGGVLLPVRTCHRAAYVASHRTRRCHNPSSDTDLFRTSQRRSSGDRHGSRSGHCRGIHHHIRTHHCHGSRRRIHPCTNVSVRNYCRTNDQNSPRRGKTLS
jgi:hypothetical protein